MTLLGYEIALPGQWEIAKFRQRQRTQRQEVAHRRKQIVERQLNFNRHTYPNQNEPETISFNEGELIMVKNYNPTEPFAPPWVGPCRIVEVLSEQMYTVDRGGKYWQYHVDQLRPAPTVNDHLFEDEDEDDDDPPTGRENDEHDAPGTRQSLRGPAETDVDRGPSTSGQPAQSLNGIRRGTSEI